jgi:hypothetical protein
LIGLRYLAATHPYVSPARSPSIPSINFQPLKSCTEGSSVRYKMPPPSIFPRILPRGFTYKSKGARMGACPSVIIRVTISAHVSEEEACAVPVAMNSAAIPTSRILRIGLIILFTDSILLTICALTFYLRHSPSLRITAHPSVFGWLHVVFRVTPALGICFGDTSVLQFTKTSAVFFILRGC